MCVPCLGSSPAMRCAPAAAFDAAPLTACFASTADSIMLGISLCVHVNVDCVRKL